MREIEFWVIFVIKILISKYKISQLSFIHMIMLTLGPMEIYYEKIYIINTYIHYLELNVKHLKIWVKKTTTWICLWYEVIMNLQQILSVMKF
jgi:hypothetical protein